MRRVAPTRDPGTQAAEGIFFYRSGEYNLLHLLEREISRDQRSRVRRVDGVVRIEKVTGDGRRRCGAVVAGVRSGEREGAQGTALDKGGRDLGGRRGLRDVAGDVRQSQEHCRGLPFFRDLAQQNRSRLVPWSLAYRSGTSRRQ